jgi:hypothetical protein
MLEVKAGLRLLHLGMISCGLIVTMDVCCRPRVLIVLNAGTGVKQKRVKPKRMIDSSAPAATILKISN